MPAHRAAVVAVALALAASCGGGEQTARYDRVGFCAELARFDAGPSGDADMTPESALALVRRLAASGPPALTTGLQAWVRYQEDLLPLADELRRDDPTPTEARRVELQRQVEALDAAFRPTGERLTPLLRAECPGFGEPAPSEEPARPEARQRSVFTLAGGTTVRFVETEGAEGPAYLCILIDQPESISGTYVVDPLRCSSSEDPLLPGSTAEVLRPTPRTGLALPDGFVHPVFAVQLPAGHPEPVTVRDALGTTWPSATSPAGVLTVLDPGSGATGLRETLELVGPDGAIWARVEPRGP